MKAKGLKYVGLVFIAFSLAMVGFSCRKKGDTYAKIKVIDTAGQPVNNCMVILKGEPTCQNCEQYVIIRNDTQYTDVSGVATFNYTDVYQLGQAGFTVLNILARKDSMIGEGIIKIVEEKTSEETVQLQPY